MCCRGEHRLLAGPAPGGSQQLRLANLLQARRLVKLLLPELHQHRHHLLRAGQSVRSRASRRCVWRQEAAQGACARRPGRRLEVQAARLVRSLTSRGTGLEKGCVEMTCCAVRPLRQVRKQAARPGQPAQPAGQERPRAVPGGGASRPRRAAPRVRNQPRELVAHLYAGRFLGRFL
jgi:hypothetical protein